MHRPVNPGKGEQLYKWGQTSVRNENFTVNKVHPCGSNIPPRRTDNVINAPYTVNLRVYRMDQIHRHPYDVLLPKLE
jgi:hypothetical protein